VNIDEGMPVQLINCIFEENVAIHDGGAVGSMGGWPRIEDCLFRNNSAERGGAMDLSHNQFFVEGCTFIGNASTDGGALYISGAHQAEISHCTFQGNGANRGAALSVLGSGLLNLDLSTSIIAFSPEGEGLYWNGADTLTLSHVDIHGNAGGDWLGDIAYQLGADGNVDLDPIFCDADADDLTLREDSPCLPAGNPDSVLIGAHGEGCEIPTAAGQPAETPPALLRGAHPNPFNPFVTIRFALPRAGRATLRIHDAGGRQVATIADERFAAGEWRRTWNGRDAQGRAAASGVYHAVLDVDGSRESLKLVLLR